MILVVLAISALQLGVWATLFPRSFFDDFPGGGRTWVAVDGPYNEHLVRDFGGLNLALFVVLAVAVVVMTPLIVRTAAVAYFLFALPHLVYHARHLDVYSTGDKFANAVLLSVGVLLPVAILVLSRTPRPRLLQ
jgi:hypothetical protein